MTGRESTGRSGGEDTGTRPDGAGSDVESRRGQSAPEPDRSGALPPWFPLALAALGVVVLAATVRTVGGLNQGVGDGPVSGQRMLVVLPMVVALVWVAVAFGKRRDPGFGVLNRAGAATVALLVGVAVAASLALILVGRPAEVPLVSSPDTRPEPSATRSFPSLTPKAVPTVKPGDNSAALPLGLLLGAIFVFVAVLAFLALLQAVRRPKIPGGLSPGVYTPLDEADELAEAVEAGAQALEYAGDAREAVIACYAAMEEAVQSFGFARPLADTPEDLLRRATEKGLVPGPAATRLTDLFREARFSRHPITETLRDEARSALAGIAAHVRDMQEKAAEAAAAQAAARAALDAQRAAADTARPAQERAGR